MIVLAYIVVGFLAGAGAAIAVAALHARRYKKGK